MSDFRTTRTKRKTKLQFHYSSIKNNLRQFLFPLAREPEKTQTETCRECLDTRVDASEK